MKPIITVLYSHGRNSSPWFSQKIVPFGSKYNHNLHLLNGEHGLNNNTKLISALLKQFLIDCKKDSEKTVVIPK